MYQEYIWKGFDRESAIIFLDHQDLKGLRDIIAYFDEHPEKLEYEPFIQEFIKSYNSSDCFPKHFSSIVRGLTNLIQ